MKRVFILSSHPLFGECIRALLGQDQQVQIVGHTRELCQAIEQIRLLQPDVVILDSIESEPVRGQIMMQILNEQLKTDVVWVNLGDNKILVCHGEQRTITELSEFLAMINSVERSD